MKSLELLVERIILSSRWILVVFYLGLVAALAVYAVSFLYKFIKVAKNVFVFDDAEMILAMLGLIDAALVASLILSLAHEGPSYGILLWATSLTITAFCVVATLAFRPRSLRLLAWIADRMDSRKT